MRRLSRDLSGEARAAVRVLREAAILQVRSRVNPSMK